MTKVKESFFEKIEDGVVETAKDFVNGKVKKRVYRFGEFSLFLILSIVMISFGISFLIGKFVPILDGGFNFIIVGTLFLIISLYLK
jgi:hypothetical protein